MKRLNAVTGAALLLAALPCAQAAETPYPTKPIRIVSPFAPGGGTDLLSRLIAQGLTEAWGQTVIVDNRPGAGTMIGTEIVKNAPADGYTLLVAAAAHTINPSLYAKVNYDPVKDFTPVTMEVAFPFLLVVHPSSSARSVKDLIALAKAQPGKLTFSSSGTGNTNHLAGELFKSMAGVELTHVPYKGGGPALTAAMSGEVSLLFTTVLSSLQQVKAGKLRALAISSATRSKFAPDIPTIAEVALPGYEATGWYALLVPSATPRPIVLKLNKEIVAILERDAVRQKIMDTGVEPWPTTVEQAQKFIGEETARWRKVIGELGLKAD